MTVWLLSTCVLIAVLMLLRRALRGRADPRLVYALWLLAAVRVLVPGSLFDLPMSVSGLAESAGVTQAVEDARYATQREETYGSKHSGQADVEDIHGLEDMDWVRRESWLGSQNITDVEVVDAQEVPAEEAGGDPDSGSTYVRLELEVTRDRFAFLRYIWYAGIALVAVWFLFVNLRFARRLRKLGVPYTEALPMDCPLPVYVVDGLSTPCLAGLVRPAIYLNRAALNSGHLDHILTHELVHYRHRDHWWAVVRCACLAVQWFNPLVWAAAYLSRQDCETACDASAIGRLGEGERLAYGHTLVNMIAAGRHPAALFQTATTMTGSLTSIRLRVTLIAQKPRMTALTLAAALVVSLVAAGCAWLGFGAAASLSRRAEGLEDMASALALLERELELGAPPLPALMEELARRAPEGASPMFQGCCQGLERLDEEDFSSLWRRLAAGCDDLGREGQACLARLGDVLGRYDAREQRQAVAAVRLRLEELAGQSRAERRSQGRVYQTLGLSGGAFLIILLL